MIYELPKRYWVIQYEKNQPQGGLTDLVFETRHKGIAIEFCQRERYKNPTDIIELFDIYTNQEVDYE